MPCSRRSGCSEWGSTRWTDGVGVPRHQRICAALVDLRARTGWYRLAADQGHAGAQYELGNNYALGQGVPQHYAEAVRWYRLADQGVAWAQTYLWNMYETGKGVPPSYVQAHMWHNLVASRTSGEQRDSAVEARDRVAGLMIPTQIAEAQRLAREWDAAHPR